METYNIMRGAGMHKGKTVEQTDMFCRNAKAILETYVANNKWDVSIAISYNCTNIFPKQLETIFERIKMLEQYIAQNENSYEEYLNADDVLNHYE